MAAPQRSQVDAAPEDFPVHRGTDHRDRSRDGASRRVRQKRQRHEFGWKLGHRQLASREGTGVQMTKNHLFRDKAPITEAGWAEIEKEAKRTLRAILAARRVVDFRGPMGWDDSEAEIGRADPIASPPHGKDVQARLRRIQPLVELRIPFEVSRVELDAIDRGARDPDLDTVTAAAREIAIAEDRSVFHGYKAAHITGICEARKGVSVPMGTSQTDYPLAVATA